MIIVSILPWNYHFVREMFVARDVVLHYVPTSLRIADIFVKELSSKQFLLLKFNLSVRLPDQIEGA